MPEFHRVYGQPSQYTSSSEYARGLNLLWKQFEYLKKTLMEL